MMWIKGRIHFSKGFFPLLISSLIILFFAGCAENSSILDNGQSRQLEFSVKICNWNNSNSSSSDYKPFSRATPISGNVFDISKSFNVIADVNKGSNWSTEVKDETASYSTANNIWQTSKIHYWPGSGSTVNFYAYYPTSILNKITHTTGSAPVLSYTVPDNATDQIDILASAKTGVAGDSYNQTPVDFKHIFAAVQFKSGSAGLPDGTGAVLKIKNIQYKGTYTFGSGWTIFPDVKDLSQTVNLSTFGTSADITNDGETLMMLPQTFSNVTIEITYTNGLVLSKTINGTWEAGKTYIYNLTKSITYNFDYTGNVQTFTVPYTGTYKLEVWGAQGGGWGYHINASGGYAGGFKKLTKGDVLYIVVGGKGYDENHYSDGSSYNGGGTGSISGNDIYGGGGATHIATRSGCLKDLSEYRSTVLVVGGGAGSNGEWAEQDSCKYESGGGEVGLGSNTTCYYWIDQSKDITGTLTTSGDTGGTQAGTGPDGIKGGFGYGGNASGAAGAGGGGWFGGNASGDGGVAYQTNGGGGSGYIGGVDNGSFQTGVRSGDGYARITFISAN